jgi:hypothetical protein
VPERWTSLSRAAGLRAQVESNVTEREFVVNVPTSSAAVPSVSIAVAVLPRHITLTTSVLVLGQPAETLVRLANEWNKALVGSTVVLVFPELQLRTAVPVVPMSALGDPGRASSAVWMLLDTALAGHVRSAKALVETMEPLLKLMAVGAQLVINF